MGGVKSKRPPGVDPLQGQMLAIRPLSSIQACRVRSSPPGVDPGLQGSSQASRGRSRPPGVDPGLQESIHTARGRSKVPGVD